MKNAWESILNRMITTKVYSEEQQPVIELKSIKKMPMELKENLLILKNQPPVNKLPLKDEKFWVKEIMEKHLLLLMMY